MEQLMCVTPGKLPIRKGPGWEEINIPCKQCWQCRSNRVSDYEGRSLCEASTAYHTCTVTLTYAPRDDLADKVITPKHFQAAVRALRFAGHPLRYLAVGEYGERKGRAHFHAILFFKAPPPEMPQQQNFHASWWPHGHIFCDHNIDPRTVRYVTKYVLKQDLGSHWLTMSKKPPLGGEWFRQKAMANVEAGVMPATFTYHPPGGYKGREYLMSKTTRRNYLADILAGYAAQGTTVNPMHLSQWIVKQFDQNALARHEAAFYALPPEEITRLILDETLSKRPSDRAVQKVLFDTDPNLDLFLDWDRIRKGWADGTSQNKRGRGSRRSVKDRASQAGMGSVSDRSSTHDAKASDGHNPSIPAGHRGAEAAQASATSRPPFDRSGGTSSAAAERSPAGRSRPKAVQPAQTRAEYTTNRRAAKAANAARRTATQRTGGRSKLQKTTD